MESSSSITVQDTASALLLRLRAAAYGKSVLAAGGEIPVVARHFLELNRKRFRSGCLEAA